MYDEFAGRKHAHEERINAEQTRWKIGELAKRTGITVRTLHHYDQIDLLVPSMHSDAGHRLYSATDIARLQQILSLKQLGFHLEPSVRMSITSNLGFKYTEYSRKGDLTCVSNLFRYDKKSD